MQTQPQNENAIRFGSGVLKVNGVNMGLLDDAELNINWSIIEIAANNGKLRPKKKPEEITFTASLYEFDLEKFVNNIDDHGVLSSTTASSTNTQDIISSGFTTGKLYLFKNQNGDGTKPTVNSVSGSSDGTLTEDDDFFVRQNERGEWGVILAEISEATNLSTTSQDITVDYDYTPKASEKVTYSDVIKALSFNNVEFENTDANGNKFRLNIPKAYQNGNYTLSYPADDATDTTLTIPIQFKAFPKDNNELMSIYDEQAV